VSRVHHRPPVRHAKAQLSGGPLHGCTVRTTPGAETILVPGQRGRYVQFDADLWFWETDAADTEPSGSAR
jgi:hypothetical protein